MRFGLKEGREFASARIQLVAVNLLSSAGSKEDPVLWTVYPRLSSGPIKKSDSVDVQFIRLLHDDPFDPTTASLVMGTTDGNIVQWKIDPFTILSKLSDEIESNHCFSSGSSVEGSLLPSNAIFVGSSVESIMRGSDGSLLAAVSGTLPFIKFHKVNH